MSRRPWARLTRGCRRSTSPPTCVPRTAQSWTPGASWCSTWMPGASCCPTLDPCHRVASGRPLALLLQEGAATDACNERVELTPLSGATFCSSLKLCQRRCFIRGFRCFFLPLHRPFVLQPLVHPTVVKLNAMAFATVVFFKIP